MTKSMRISLLCLFAITFATLFTGCSKDDDNDPVSRTELLTQNIWKIDHSGIDADKNGTIDLADTWESCELDNTFNFIADGNGIFDEGASKCNSADAQSGTFTWSFNSDETVLNGDISQLSLSGAANITILSATTLEVYKDITLSGTSETIRYIIRLKH